MMKELQNSGESSKEAFEAALYASGPTAVFSISINSALRSTGLSIYFPFLKSSLISK